MTPDPFLISGPAVVSFSGGRTSAYMLHRILQAHGGTLPADVLVCFANTGREMPATLDFVHRCATEWAVPVHWLEYRRDAATGHVTAEAVSHNSASRNGEPFEQMLDGKQMLPNPVMRFCTTELKVRTLQRWVRATLGWDRWTNVVGLRADEPHRVARHRETLGKRRRDRWVVAMPLADAGITSEDVMAFWRVQPFDLGLAGKWEGNCDGCFLKRTAALARMWRDHPGRMAWWQRMEEERAHKGTIDPSIALFRKDRPAVSEIGRLEFSQGRLDLLDPDAEAFDPMANCEGGCGI